MSQLHKRFTDEQIKVLFQGYCQGKMKRIEIQDLMEIGKTRFFAILKKYRQNPEGFSINYQRASLAKLSVQAEAEIEKALLQEKKIVENPDLPISGYNYAAMQDRLKEKGVQVSTTTIIDRAKKLDCHKPRRKRKRHDREVLTASIGALIQHDASLHQWSPFAKEKWYLITSIDDFSRKLLFADFFEKRDHLGAYSGGSGPDADLWITFALLCGLTTRLSFRARPGQLLAQAYLANG